MIHDIIKKRGISEVLHFTTLPGLVGILASKYLRSRARIADDELLQFILKLNSEIRKDTDWLDYVNLSISRINHNFFTSSAGWHDIDWRILSFNPEILSHEGVVFTTTNNVYDSVVERDYGEQGLENMFSPRVKWGYYGSVISRDASYRDNFPTDIQAEVLYPGEISIEYLEHIYVMTEQDHDQVSGVLTALHIKNPIEILIDPDKFKRS